MTVRRGKIMFVIGLILAIGGLSGAGPQVFSPRPAQATTTGCTPSTDLFGCAVTGTSSSYGLLIENSSTTNYMMAVVGNATGTSGVTQAVYGQVVSPVGRAVVGYSKATSGESMGVHARTDSTSGIGADGYAATTTGTNYGVRGRTESGSGYGVFGANLSTSGSSSGVYGTSNSSSGIGTDGYAAATSGANYGVRGRTQSSSGYGVYGANLATSGSSTGVYGTSSSASGIGTDGYAAATFGTNYGVRGRTQSGSGYGVFGANLSTSGSSSGVYGTSNSSSGIGTDGYAAATFGTNYGVRGRTQSSSGYGVYGANLATSGSTSGVFGVSNSPSGSGVRGEGPLRGVYGYSAIGDGAWAWSDSTSATNAGIVIYGPTGLSAHTTLAGGKAGNFEGTVEIDGDLNVVNGSKNFKMDHPLDPANKYLYHAAIEAPEMKNIYDGNVTTDANGEAVVTLPDYFEALNQDFRYQLTVVGQFAQAIVASEIQGNSFTIKTDQPFVKVSWQVTGIRNDPYAQDNPFQAEVDKPQAEQGTYLYPQGYDQPQTKDVDYAEQQRTRFK